MKKKIKDMTKDEYREYVRSGYHKRKYKASETRLKQMREYSKKYYANPKIKEKQSEYYRILKLLKKFPENLQ